jgi:arylsulfatase A
MRPILPIGIVLLVAHLGSAETPHPNILLMMADDMGMGDTSAYQDFTGNVDEVQLRTPQMDRLARLGIRFTDAHTPSSRCSPTRYGLLTGRYPWRNRLKYWVLFGAQGDPMIEADRPTLASMLAGEGFATAMVGKWHVGLRYRQTDGSPAAGWDDADLTQPLFTTPINHGFQYARFTSRSHGTSGPAVVVGAELKAAGKPLSKNQRGPGHVHDHTVVGATGVGRQLVTKGCNAYVLKKLGSRHSDHAIAYLSEHVTQAATQKKPFFLYYASNANHGPYTPDDAIDGVPVAGAAWTVAEEPMDARYDFIYENDVALGRMLDWLEATEDPRNPGRKLIETTFVLFTSDNGAEKNSDTATGPFRSHKGSAYEGGHRVPFLVSWPEGGIGDGDASTPGRTSDAPISLQDLYATLAEIVGTELPNLRSGAKGAEDSHSILAALLGKPLEPRPPLFFNDHKEAKSDPAAMAIRLDSPTIDGKIFEGKWKLFFDAALIRLGEANPQELFNLAADPQETTNLLDRPENGPLVAYLNEQALLHRTAGGHRLAEFAPSRRLTYSWQSESEERRSLADVFAKTPASVVTVTDSEIGLKMTISAVLGEEPITDARFHPNFRGLGISSGQFEAIDGGEALQIRFDRDVLVESAKIIAGNGTCGGFYRMGDKAPLAIYCVDADIDDRDQSGVLSDLGVLRLGEALRLDSSPHHGVEATGQWRLAALTVRVLD